MADLTWYVNRLRQMSPAEVLSRIGIAVRQRAADDLVKTKRLPKLPERPTEPRWRLSKVSSADMDRLAPMGSRATLLGKADDICRNRLSYFDRPSQHIGDPINWHRDWHNDIEASLALSSTVDYRDVPSAGDCKQVWEPNRHHQLVVLARAWRVSGDERYAAAVRDQMLQWMDSNPYGYGMNWRSPLELAIRLINWVIALELISDWSLPDDELRTIQECLYLHCWDIGRKFSPGSSANNHVIGEAAGLYIAGRYWPDLSTPRDVRRARQILRDEIDSQVHPDGGTAEQALNYELFVMQFFTIAGLVSEWSGDSFDSGYWLALDRQYRFIESVAELGSPLPMYGDQDDGYVLDLGDHHHDAARVIALGAALRGDTEPGERAGCESALWLLGPGDPTAGQPGKDPAVYRDDGLIRHTSMTAPSVEGVLRVFQTSGVVQIQQQQYGLLFDVGPLGYGPLAAHGHADGLQVLLYVDGEPWLVDQGTYDYFSYPAWRAHLRSTRAHNTLCIDGKNQSELLGSFMFGQRADTQLVDASEDLTEQSCVVAGELTNHAELPSSTRIERSLIATQQAVVVTDLVHCPGAHSVEANWHIAPGIDVQRINDSQWRLSKGKRAVDLTFNADAKVALCTDEFMRAYSPRYHVRHEGECLTASLEFSDTASMTTQIDIATRDRA